MTSEDIVRMARETGMISDSHAAGMISFLDPFAALVAAAKQEQIARQWDALHEQYMADPLRRQMMLSYEMVARMIRGRT
jgi:hypothetical protein